MHFRVVDLDFSEVISFVTGFSTYSSQGLLKNNNIHIHMVFTDDDVTYHMLRATEQWLAICVNMNRMVQTKPSNGVRIPWIYVSLPGTRVPSI